MTKILLVEDNEMNRDMLSRRLERKGYDVILAVDGSSGIKAAVVFAATFASDAPQEEQNFTPIGLR